MTEDIKAIFEENELKLCVKENDIYINIPKEILNKGMKLIKEYIKIYKNIEVLKESINKYLFDRNSSINHMNILNQILQIKNEECFNEIEPFIDTNINDIENKLLNMCLAFNINIEDINALKEELSQSYANNTENLNNIIDKEYVKDIINYIENNEIYSLNQKSRYGSISSEYEVKNKSEIVDKNEEETNGEYSPILVIHRPAKYHRGTYILEENSYVYIKRQPLEALIKQEKLEEKGIDSMGAILYKKLKHDLTNENLQELLAELYVYSQKNSSQFDNIKLADITSNKVWMTADKLKKEFKELRYYHKNLTQKVKEIYDSTGAYYTQIGGKYIFNSREFLHSYKTYKGKDITN